MNGLQIGETEAGARAALAAAEVRWFKANVAAERAALAAEVAKADEKRAAAEWRELRFKF